MASTQLCQGGRESDTWALLRGNNGRPRMYLKPLRGRTVSEPTMANPNHNRLSSFVGQQERQSSAPNYREPAVRDRAETPRWLIDASHQLTGESSEHLVKSQGTTPRRESQNTGRESGGRGRSETPSWLQDASNYLKGSSIPKLEKSAISESTSLPCANPPGQSPMAALNRGPFMCCMIRGKPLGARATKAI